MVSGIREHDWDFKGEQGAEKDLQPAYSELNMAEVGELPITSPLS